MTGKISLTIAALLIALSAPAIAATARVSPRHAASVSVRAAEPANSIDKMSSEGAAAAYHYHGGPKTND
jgi:hypothetical protein